MNVLWKYFDFFHNHTCTPLTAEQINCLLLSQSSWYFLECYFLLNQYFQKGHKFKSAWWSPLQFAHLKVYRYSSSCLVLNLGELVLKLVLQHHMNWWWYSVLCGPLHLTHLDPWILYKKVAWPYFQQFLHCRTSRFMFAPWIVTM